MTGNDGDLPTIGPGGADETRLSSHGSNATSSGWLTSSGSIDHGRFAPGTILENRYRVIGLLGRGGMGEVYRADDLRLGQPVALKFLPGNLGRDPARLAQFHNEVRTARQVSHPNVCRVYDIGDAAGELFLTMEYVDGEDLSSLLRRIGRLPEDKAVEIARQICAGLAAAHERGIIHRDLKPANIMLDGAGRVRVMDFSLASVGAVSGAVAGTPAYMAPEQLQGREVDARSDIYALGLVCYELFTGRRAFDATSIADLVAQQTSGEMTPPASLVKGLDEAIERVILRCLERDPSRRPASPLAVAAALPGGDPLAAALAAGETPSPEMVAAAGGEAATVSPVAGIAWIALVAALIVAVPWLADRTLLVARVPLTKPPAVLLDRAEEIRHTLGYVDVPVDRAFGLYHNTDYLTWGGRNGSGEAGWSELGTGRPAGLLFWYRTSPVAMIPVDKLSIADQFDPPVAIAGMTSIVLDTTGRLVEFTAVPPEVEAAPAAPAVADWPALFRAAGLDMATFTEAKPGRTPPDFADDRRAWTGVLPERQVPVTIEAAAYRSRPVFFKVVAPWTVASRDPNAANAARSGAGSTALILVLLVAAVILARRNLRSGRADRRGAFRLGTAMFLLYTATWLLAPHVIALEQETNRLFTYVGIGMFVGSVMCLVYLALEPFVRRSWPTMLVGWSRALAGRLRDPVVGRDLLIGTACGLALSAIEHGNAIVPGLLGWPAPAPLTSNLGALEHTRYFGLTITSSLNNGLQNGLLSVMMFTLVRENIKRVLGRLAPSRWSTDAISAGIAIAMFTLIRLVDAPVDPSRLWFVGAYEILSAGGFLFVLARYGLLATVVMYTINALTLRMPLTLRHESLYAGPAWVTLAMVLAVAALGLWLARPNEGVVGSQAGVRYS